MSNVKEIESALTQLPLEDLQSVREWLDDFIEDQLEVSDEFKGKILRAKQEIADGVYSRTRMAECRGLAPLARRHALFSKQARHA